MKTLQLSWLVLLSLLLFACNTEPQNVLIASDVVIQLTAEPDPPTTGASTLIITVFDKDGNAIEGAKVSVHGDMDHEGMTPSEGDSSESNEGIYRIPFEWSMGGGWILDVRVTLPDNAGIAREQFELFVGAISENSIVNQGDTDTAEMDHSAMEGMKSDIQIHYMSDNDPALAGDAIITIILTTQDGLPIDDASLALHATMPEHDMLPVTGTSDGGEKGRYTIPLIWTMAGEWQVDLTITLADAQKLMQTYTQQVIMPDESIEDMTDMPEHNHSGS